MTVIADELSRDAWEEQKLGRTNRCKGFRNHVWGGGGKSYETRTGKKTKGRSSDA